ncbi:MAG: PilZ domain-containing protein [Bdellovibrionaceae bacterium]|nr:PilZ domain-containing protein [Pseudobdellovibrionaceae bacterium]
MPKDSNTDTTHFNHPVQDKTKQELLRMLSTTKTNVKVYLDQKIFESVTYPTTDLTRISVICSNSTTNQSFKIGKNLTCHFSLHNEIYFFTSKTSFTDAAVIFSLPDIVYKIQRRDNFRVFIPKNMTQYLEIVGLKQLKISMVDLSLGGCKVTALYPDASHISHLKAGAEIALKMTFLNFENLTIYCKVKFIKDNPITRSASMGLEFEKLKAEEIQDMQATIFKIDRLNRQNNQD